MEVVRDNSGKKTTSWSKNITYEDGSSKSIRIEQCENGYIICIDKYKPGCDGCESQSDYKKYISFDNPMESKKKNVEEYNISEVLKNI